MAKTAVVTFCKKSAIQATLQAQLDAASITTMYNHAVIQIGFDEYACYLSFT